MLSLVHVWCNMNYNPAIESLITYCMVIHCIAIVYLRVETKRRTKSEGPVVWQQTSKVLLQVAGLKEYTIAMQALYEWQ